MTRIVAGQARGRRLKVPAGSSTRPTADRVREALFSSLSSTLGSWHGRRVLDLFAGSGALGLEALSRGAEHALLIESDSRAVAVIRANIAEVGLPGAVVVKQTVERALAEPVPGGVPFDVVLADPPYGVASSQLSDLLGNLSANGWLAPDAVLVVERDRRSPPLDWPAAFEADQVRDYGETTLYYARPQSGCQA